MSLYSQFLAASDRGRFNDFMRELCERVEALETEKKSQLWKANESGVLMEYNGGPLVVGDGVPAEETKAATKTLTLKGAHA